VGLILSQELQNKIKRLLNTDEDLKQKLLKGDVDSIRQISSISQKGINPKAVIEAYESNSIEEIYKEAQKLLELQQLYKELCFEYYKEVTKGNIQEER
jgi:hypothetical protein